MLGEIMSGGVFYSVMKLTGHENANLMSSITNATYDQYGFEYTEGNYTIEDNGSTLSGTYPKLFKVSLDPTKIDALVEAYSIVALPQNLKPVIKIVDTDDDEISFKVTVDDDSRQYRCYIYRSTSENGTYTAIYNEAYDCSKGTTVVITDDSVVKGSKYYYKAAIDNGSDFETDLADFGNAVANGNVSSAVAAKASTAASGGGTNHGTNDVKKNPNTGVGDSSIVLIIGAVLSCSAIYVLSRKQKMQV